MCVRNTERGARRVALCLCLDGVIYSGVTSTERRPAAANITSRQRPAEDQQRETEKTSGAAFCVRVSVSLLSLCIDTKKRDQRGGGLSVCLVCYGVLNVVTVAVSLPNVRGGVTIRAAFFGGVYFGGGDTICGGA